MNQYTEELDCARKYCMYSNVSYAQLPQLEWCNVCMYAAIVLVLCYIPMVTSMVYDVINYRHRIVQVAIYSIPYLFHHGYIIKCVCINY